MIREVDLRRRLGMIGTEARNTSPDLDPNPLGDITRNIVIVQDQEMTSMIDTDMKEVQEVTDETEMISMTEERGHIPRKVKT